MNLNMHYPSTAPLLYRNISFFFFFFLTTRVVCVVAGKQHSSDFSRLIAQVRGRLETRQSRVKAEAAEEDTDEPGTHSAGTATLINFREGKTS